MPSRQFWDSAMFLFLGNCNFVPSAFHRCEARPALISRETGINVLELAAQYQVGIYLCFFFLPFLQEDVAILGAASACASGLGNSVLGFSLVLLGLVVSEALKYGLGWSANHQSWAKKYADKPSIQNIEGKVKDNLGKTLFAARFISALRIPAYLASGYFKVPFIKFLIIIAATAAVYLAIAFSLFHIFGEVAGEKLKIYLPIAAIILLIIFFIASRLKTSKSVT